MFAAQSSNNFSHNWGKSYLERLPSLQARFTQGIHREVDLIIILESKIDGLVRSQAASFIKIWLPKLSRPK